MSSIESKLVLHFNDGKEPTQAEFEAFIDRYYASEGERLMAAAAAEFGDSGVVPSVECTGAEFRKGVSPKP